MSNELHKRIADELGISEKKVKAVDDHIFSQIQQFMKDPDKFEFMINQFGVFIPKLRSIQNYTKRVLEKGGELTPIMKKRIELYQKIITMGEEYEKRKKINGIKRNERQTEKEDNHE